jgi:hypothetical protein
MRTYSIAVPLAVLAIAYSLTTKAANLGSSPRASDQEYSAPDEEGGSQAEPVLKAGFEEPVADGDPRHFALPDECDEDRCDECALHLGCHSCPCFYGAVEALLIDQVPLVQNRQLVVDANTGAAYQWSGDLDSGFEPGIRAMVGLRLCNCLTVEFGYFGLWESGTFRTAQPDSTSYLIFPGNLAGNVFVNMGAVASSYSSYVNSFEMNFPCCCGCCCCSTCDCCETPCSECGRVHRNCGLVSCQSLEWFAGVRFLNIGNNLNMLVQRREAGGVEEGNYSVLTGNRLVGGQIGARWRNTVDRIGWELTGKAGVFGNSADQSQSVTDYPNFPLRPFTSVQGSHTAFVGEINLSVLMRLTDIWTLKVGYDVIWIQGLALAADQLDFNFATSPSGNQLYTGGGLLLHGVNFGLEARW